MLVFLCMEVSPQFRWPGMAAAGVMALVALEWDGSAVFYVDQEALMRQHHCCYPRQHGPENPARQFPFHPLSFILRKSTSVLC